ncbi:hypothetical protein EMCRGX_G006024 [Ephydatia muelleri]
MNLQIVNIATLNSVLNACVFCCFTAGDSVKNLHAALDRFKDEVEHLNGMKWRRDLSNERNTSRQKREDILSQENKAKARARYKADPEKKKASVRDTYKVDPEKKKASVRDTYNANAVSKRAAKRQRYQEGVEENRAAKRQRYQEGVEENRAAKRQRYQEGVEENRAAKRQRYQEGVEENRAAKRQRYQEGVEENRAAKRQRYQEGVEENRAAKGSDIKRASRRTVLLIGGYTGAIQLPLRQLEGVGIGRVVELPLPPKALKALVATVHVVNQAAYVLHVHLDVLAIVQIMAPTSISIVAPPNTTVTSTISTPIIPQPSALLLILTETIQQQSSTEGSWSLNMPQEVITLTWRVHPSQTNGLVTLLSATAIPNTTSLRSTVHFRGTYRQRSRPCHSTPWEKYKRSYLQGFETRVFPLQECRHCLKFGFQLEKLLRIRDILVETCRRAHIGVKVEVGNNLSRDHSKTRPADILLPNWFLGRTAALDVSITSPLNPVTLLEAGVSATAAAQATVARKHQANDPKCSELASRLATSTCRPKSTILHEIYGRLNLNLVCANATAILSRIAPPP